MSILLALGSTFFLCTAFSACLSVFDIKQQQLADKKELLAKLEEMKKLIESLQKDKS